MPPDSAETVTRILNEIKAGDESAKQRLFEVVHGQLRAIVGQLMKNERDAHTLQPTALVHEAAIRLLREEGLGRLANGSHFFGAMATAMRRILVDHARMRAAQRRGGGQQPVLLDEVVGFVEKSSGIDLVEIDDLLDELEQLNPRQAEVVVQRFFGGFEVREIAEHLGVSVSTVEKDWRIARAWLRRRILAS